MFLSFLFEFRLVVKTALKLLLVFVEYTESNAAVLIKAVNVVDAKRGKTSFSSVSVPWHSNCLCVVQQEVEHQLVGVGYHCFSSVLSCQFY